VRSALTGIQHDLFDLGGELSLPGHALVGETHLLRIDKLIENFNKELPPLREFVLPGGTRSAALAHVARTVCRRAERSLVALAGSEPRGRCRYSTSTGCRICCSCWPARSTCAAEPAMYCGSRKSAGHNRARQFVSSLKPFFLWVPSQNGLFCEPPQRHRKTVSPTGRDTPRELRHCARPVTLSGPSLRISIVASPMVALRVD
jgi:hypothetical protein